MKLVIEIGKLSRIYNLRVAQHGIQWQYLRDRLRTIGYFLYDRDTLPEAVGQTMRAEGAGKDSTNLEEHADEIEGNKPKP